MALICPSLPCPSLPCRALSLIREYSKPLTRPGWRNSNPVISQFKLYSYLKNNKHKYYKLKTNLLRRIQKTDWYYNYTYIQHFGMDQFYYDFGYRDILHIDGMMDAEIDYQNSIMEYESYHLRLKN